MTHWRSPDQVDIASQARWPGHLAAPAIYPSQHFCSLSPGFEDHCSAYQKHA